MRVHQKVLSYFFLFIFFQIYGVREVLGGCCTEVDNRCKDATKSSECGIPANFNPNDNCADNKCTDVVSPEESGSEAIQFNPQVTIPLSNEFVAGKSVPVGSVREGFLYADLISRFIVAIYQFGIWIAVTLSIFMMMVGGFLWTLAGGSQERVSNAKSFISHALTGLVIALLSYGILQTVNPATLNLQLPPIEVIVGKDVKEINYCCLIPQEGKEDKQIIFSAANTGLHCAEVKSGWKECPNADKHACVCTSSASGYRSVQKDCFNLSGSEQEAERECNAKDSYWRNLTKSTLQQCTFFKESCEITKATRERAISNYYIRIRP